VTPHFYSFDQIEQFCYFFYNKDVLGNNLGLSYKKSNGKTEGMKKGVKFLTPFCFLARYFP
jgi:hypothetical protein